MADWIIIWSLSVPVFRRFSFWVPIAVGYTSYSRGNSFHASYSCYDSRGPRWSLLVFNTTLSSEKGCTQGPISCYATTSHRNLKFLSKKSIAFSTSAIMQFYDEFRGMIGRGEAPTTITDFQSICSLTRQFRHSVPRNGLWPRRQRFYSFGYCAWLSSCQRLIFYFISGLY